MPEKKNSAAKIAANNRYTAKTYEKIYFRTKKDGSDGLTRESLAEAAKAAGKSTNQFILDAITEYMSK